MWPSFNFIVPLLYAVFMSMFCLIFCSGLCSHIYSFDIHAGMYIYISFHSFHSFICITPSSVMCSLLNLIYKCVCVIICLLLLYCGGVRWVGSGGSGRGVRFLCVFSGGQGMSLFFAFSHVSFLPPILPNYSLGGSGGVVILACYPFQTTAKRWRLGRFRCSALGICVDTWCGGIPIPRSMPGAGRLLTDRQPVDIGSGQVPMAGYGVGDTCCILPNTRCSQYR